MLCMNENYTHPAMPAGAAQGILSGMYLLQIAGPGKVASQHCSDRELSFGKC